MTSLRLTLRIKSGFTEAKREAERLSKRKQALSSAAVKRKVPATGPVENAMPDLLRGATGNLNIGVSPFAPE